MKRRCLSGVAVAAVLCAALSAGAQDKAPPKSDGPIKLDLKPAPDAKAAVKDAPKKKSPAQVLAGPVPPAEIAKAFEGVRDLGFVVNDPAAVFLLGRVKDFPADGFKLDENELPVTFRDLNERPDEFRGKLVGIVGAMVDVAAWKLPGGGSVLQAMLTDRNGNQFTVLLPEDPGHRNAQVRLRAYFVRTREFNADRRPSPVLVGRTWERIIVAAPTEADKKDEKPAIAVGRDGKPMGPDVEEILNMEKDLQEQDHKDPRTDTNAMFRALRWCGVLSTDAFVIREDESPVSFRALTEHPGTYMGELVVIEGIIRSVEQFPDPRRRSSLDKYWVALVSQQGSKQTATVVLANDPGPFANPYHVKFKGYMIKIREFETKAGDRGYGPVLVAHSWTVTQGPMLSAEERAGETPGWLKTVMNSKIAWWLFIGIAAVVLMWAYVARKTTPPESSAMSRLAPAEPLTSKEVIETLARMPGGPDPDSTPSSETSPAAASSEAAELPETKPVEDAPAAGGGAASTSWPPSPPKM